jgi:hypothetical protein
MKSSIKNDAATPGQVEQKASDATSQRKPSSPREGVSPLRDSTPRRSIRQVESTRGSSSSGLTSSVLEYARRTQVDAQAHRTSIRMAELDRKAQDEGRDDAVNEKVREEEPFERAYPDTTARKNVTVRRSRDRLSGRPEGIPPYSRRPTSSTILGASSG